MPKTIPEKYQSWINAVGLSVLFIFIWLAVGIFLSNSFFDSYQFKNFQVLDKQNSLGYLAVVLAIQIPIFILFLQEMVKAGFVRRKALPRVTSFKEIIFVLLTGTLLVVLSPRESYLYLPLLVIALTNFIAVYRAVTVTFHQEQYDNDIKKLLNKTATSAFIEMDERRRKSNRRNQEIENTQFVEISYFDIDDPDTKVVPIRAKSSGVLEDLDVKGIAELLASEFVVKGNNSQNDDSEARQKAVPRLRVRSAMYYKVEVEDTIAELIVPASYEGVKKLTKKLDRFFKVSTKLQKLPVLKFFDEIILEFERAVDKSIKNNDVKLLEEMLEKLKFMLNEIDACIESDAINKKGDNYRLDHAFQEFSLMVSDDFSKYLRRIYDLLSESLSKCIQQEKPDLAHELIRYSYRDMLNSVERQNISTIARSDSVISYNVGQFVYKNAWNSNLSTIQSELRQSLFFRLKEHTDLLRYELKNDSGQYDPDNIIQQWFEKRVTRLRDLTLNSIKSGHDQNFSDSFNILIEIEGDAYSDRLSQENDNLIKCTIFMIAAYLKHRDMLESGYGKSVLGCINKWNDNQLLSVLIECFKQEYSGNWNIDTYDHLADGVMRSVPDYNQIIRRLWADVMLNRRFSTDVNQYDNKHELEETLLFTGGLSNDENIDLLNYLKDMKSSKTKDLETLVSGFIKLRRDWEANKLSDLPLDKAKTNKFREEVNKAYLETSIASNIFKVPTSLEIDKSKATRNYKDFGINQVFDKEAFITDWHSGYITDHLAEQLGRQIAQGHDKYVFEKLLSEYDSLESIDELIEATKNTVGNPALVVSNNIHGYELDKYSKFLSRKSDYQNQYIASIKQKLPIQKVFSDKLAKGLYVLCQNEVGKLYQKEQSAKPVRVSIDAYSDNQKLLNGLLKQQPEWLAKRGDSEEQKVYLKTKVRLKVAYVFKYEEPVTNNKVLFFPIDREN